MRLFGCNKKKLLNAIKTTFTVFSTAIKAIKHGQKRLQHHGVRLTINTPMSLICQVIHRPDRILTSMAALDIFNFMFITIAWLCDTDGNSDETIN